MSRRAVILAGGKGTRLRPYTVVLPKPLMPIGDYPILEVIVRQLASFRFDHITMAVNYQANLIKAFFGDGESWKVHIDYSLETEPLSTIAPLKLIPDLPQNFLLLNGDVLTDLDMAALLDAHVSGRRFFTIASTERTHTIDYGVLHVNSSDTLTGFNEKPVESYLVSMGIYAMDRDILSTVPSGQKYGFDDLMRDMLKLRKPVHVQKHSGFWLDIGRPDDYMQAIEEFAHYKDRLLQQGVSRVPLEVERRFSDPIHVESGCESSRKGEKRRGETLSHDPQEGHPGAGSSPEQERTHATADGGVDREVEAGGG